MKRIAKAISIILAMILAFSGLSVSVFAAGESSLTISVFDDFAAVTSCYDFASGVIDIPSEKNGYPVTTIAANAFENCNKITQVNIPASVTKIDDNAFDNCTELTKVVFAGENCEIGEAAFKTCSKLTDIDLPSGLKAIADETFYDCTSLVEIEIPDSVEIIGKEAFRICNSLAKVDIPSSVKVIKKNAFIGCTSVTEYNVAAENEVYSSVNGVLYGPYQSSFDDDYANPVTDKALIQYPASKADTVYTVEEGTVIIADCAFGNSKNITNVVLPEGLEIIDAYAFSETPLAQVEIPSTVTKIGKLAFNKCTALKSITIPASVTDFDSAFYMSGLESVVIETGVKTISARAFDGCTSLKQVSIPSSVENIGMGAFYGCSGLGELIVPATVTTIGNDAFGLCQNIVLVVEKDSTAHTYAVENEINYRFKNESDEPTTKPTEPTTQPDTNPDEPTAKPDDTTTKPADRKVTSIEIIKLPNKTSYYYKEAIDTSGMELMVNYSDGSSEMVKSGFKLSHSTCTDTGTLDIEVEYGGCRDTFQIEVSFAWWQWIIWILLLGFIWY